MPSRGRVVWSTDPAGRCPRCGRPQTACTCKAKTTVPSGDGVVRVGRSTKGRKGKGVTVVTGVPLPPTELGALAKELKRRCGSGGTVKDGEIEIQGDHRDRLVEVLRERGWTVKRAGG